MGSFNTQGWLAGCLLAAGLSLAAPLSQAADLKVQWPLGRTVYQTNELIDLAVQRHDAAALPAGELVLTLAGPAGSQVVARFPLAAVPVAGQDARATELYRLNGWLLRPGAYTVTVAADGATATSAIEVYSHVRQSTFRIIDWASRADAKTFPLMGADSLGFNTILGNFRLGQTANVEGAIRGGLDYMQVCTMSGAHQMDLRSECDWSDPYVLGGGVARGVQQAFISRTTPNCLGVHFYDEPGLTWEGDAGPFGVTAQHQSYFRSFGKEAPKFADMKPDDPQFRADWIKWHNWHEGFMDAAWKHSAFGVTYTQPDFLPITQSVYGFTAYADGYYFNVVRSLPLISGHGGYSDGHTGFYYPGWHMEYGRLRDLPKPYWYLPSWYHMTPDQYRVEQFLSFQNNLQGLAKPPDLPVQTPNSCAEATGIVEVNKLAARLGTIFTTMPVTRPPVAVLFSMSQLLDGEMRDIVATPKETGRWGYEGGGHSRAASLEAYIASKALHIPFFPVVEEDIADGTLAANHRVLVVPHVNALDAKVVTALGDFIRGGGVVLVSDESKVVIPGALKIGAPLPVEFYETTGAWWQKDQKQYFIQASAGHYRKALAPFIAALGAQLKAAGITPVVGCDNPAVVVSRQAEGDVEYLFAVNGLNDMDVNMNATLATTATLTFPLDGRPLYDAVRGGLVTDPGPATPAEAKTRSVTIRFGAGAMRVFARTARPIGGVQLLPVQQAADYTVASNPRHITVGALVVDAQQAVLSGSIPLQVRVTDPLGAVRYELYRATAHGLLQLDLPLAANDPAGVWQVSVRELLNFKEATTRFTYTPGVTCGALAGAVQRAVTFGNDRAQIFRFFKLHQDVTIATGSSAYNAAAAARLTTVLAPWGVRCKTVAAAELNKPRTVPAEAQRSWAGLDAGKPDFKTAPPVSQVGFAVDGPVILLGTPEDNPLIKFAQDKGFLPYRAAADVFPGRGGAYLAWQTDAVGYFNQESIALIAYDEAGMAEAVGTTYEIAAGVDPLTALALPASTTVAPATTPATVIAAPVVVCRAFLPDRITGLQATADGCIAIAHDGTVATIGPRGETVPKVIAATAADEQAKPLVATLDAELVKKLQTPGVIAKFTQPLDGGLIAVAYWGGLLQVVAADGAVNLQQQCPQDITALAAGKGQVLVGLSTGEVLVLAVGK